VRRSPADGTGGELPHRGGGAGSDFGLTEIRLGLWPFLVYRAVERAMGSGARWN